MMLCLVPAWKEPTVITPASLGGRVRLAQVARADGVDVTLDVWDGMWHGWHDRPGITEAEQACAEENGGPEVALAEVVRSAAGAEELEDEAGRAAVLAVGERDEGGGDEPDEGDGDARPAGHPEEVGIEGLHTLCKLTHHNICAIAPQIA